MIWRAQMPAKTSEKRKQVIEDEDAATLEPRKRPLNDAFKSLSIQSKHIQHLRDTDGAIPARSRTYSANAKEAHLQYANDKLQHNAADSDVEMRENSSYAKDAHTIVVTSLDDEYSDAESQADAEDAALYVFNLPGRIDGTFSGTKGIPAALLEQHREPVNQQMVLYKGTPSEVVERSIGSKQQIQNGNASEDYAGGIADVDVMDLD